MFVSNLNAGQQFERYNMKCKLNLNGVSRIRLLHTTKWLSKSFFQYYTYKKALKLIYLFNGKMIKKNHILCPQEDKVQFV